MAFALLLALAAQAPPPAPPAPPPTPAADSLVRPFEVVTVAGRKGALIHLARSGDEERYVGVGCSTEWSRRLVPLARMRGVHDFWAVPGLVAGGHRVRYRFDGGAEGRARWLGRGSFVGAVEKVSKPAEFIAGLKSAGSVELRIYEVGDRYVEGRFAYTGAEPAIAEVARRCALPDDGTKRAD